MRGSVFRIKIMDYVGIDYYSLLVERHCLYDRNHELCMHCRSSLFTAREASFFGSESWITYVLSIIILYSEAALLRTESSYALSIIIFYREAPFFGSESWIMYELLIIILYREAALLRSESWIIYALSIINIYRKRGNVLWIWIMDYICIIDHHSLLQRKHFFLFLSGSVSYQLIFAFDHFLFIEGRSFVRIGVVFGIVDYHSFHKF